ncbi:hypothetical protein ABZY58_11085 [Micromonospora tulbaghiae]|uniref:hypothetical protein n=1 Tax=Micromonospora tulbaghiae TaxID=479978 RepID=UPI00339E3188
MTALTLPADQAAAIYDVLIEHAGASPDGRAAFIDVQTGSQCDEYRFGGSLGFGGKLWIDQDGWRVSAYAEDIQRKPSIRDTIAVTNAALATLRAGSEAATNQR